MTGALAGGLAGMGMGVAGHMAHKKMKKMKKGHKGHKHHKHGKVRLGLTIEMTPPAGEVLISVPDKKMKLEAAFAPQPQAPP